MKYTIIQVNTNNYDKVYDNNDLDAAERLLFTDIAHKINNWTQIKLNNNKNVQRINRIYRQGISDA